MKQHFTCAIIVSGLALGLAGCTTPYPYGTPIPGVTASANTAPRGTEAFCRTYGGQTAANRYESDIAGDDSVGSRGFSEHLARAEGERAYARCMSGRTN